jgi:hypothetical protein
MMTIVGVYPPEASTDQTAKVAFYLLIDLEHMQVSITTSNTT